MLIRCFVLALALAILAPSTRAADPAAKIDNYAITKVRILPHAGAEATLKGGPNHRFQ